MEVEGVLVASRRDQNGALSATLLDPDEAPSALGVQVKATNH